MRVSRSIIIIGVALGLILVLLFVERSVRSSSQSGFTSASGKGKLAPDFVLSSLDGKSVQLSDLHGKVVLLNFWATWCVPCKVEMPWFVELQKRYGTSGLQVVGIAMDDASQADLRKFTNELGVNYPILIGNDKVGDVYGGVQFLPFTLYVDRDGRVVDKVFGLKSENEVENEIKKAFGSPNDRSARVKGKAFAFSEVFF
jgi:cytochrome c biogenesis protein CcmG/thiol:disulfide interchange protein DsbE